MKKKITRTDLLNWWLQKYHNTTVADVIGTYPVDLLKSTDWFKAFPVTQEQHDEWYEWAIGVLSKERRIGKKVLRKLFTLDYLDAAPYVSQNENV
jgi:hypothetical protein